MSTILYPSPLFGPVSSRRLGVSLGINLLPGDGKICSFDCIYCECGFNADRRPKQKFPSRDKVRIALNDLLVDMKREGVEPDALTFAGNGEPTMHPQFASIVGDVIEIRNRVFPYAKICVLSNATQLDRPDVFEALKKLDYNIQKLDTVSPDYIKNINRPAGSYDVKNVVERLKAFNGKVIIQTMFMKGSTLDGKDAGNISDEYVNPWLDTIKYIGPESVMIYTLDRETPAEGLMKASPKEMESIRKRVVSLGIKCTVSY